MINATTAFIPPNHGSHPSQSQSHTTLPSLSISSSSTTAATVSANTTLLAPDSSIRCICGSTLDDGFSIGCDICERWCHAACFDIVDGAQVPEEWRCWECEPRTVDAQRARAIQRERITAIMVARNGNGAAPPLPSSTSAGLPAVTINGQTPAQHEADEVQEMMEEGWSRSYVHIMDDIVQSEDTRAKLQEQAMKWRGVSALSFPPSTSSSSSSTVPVRLPKETMSHPPRTSVKLVDPHTSVHPALAVSSNPSVRPPTYALHTTSPLPAESYITPYTSLLVPSSVYVNDALNSYASMGLPKPFVRLLGEPVGLALDARMVGCEGRFVRCGCRPNAVLRPVLCDEDGAGREKEKDGEGGGDGDGKEGMDFGIFATRDLKEGEEIVLGWEWDDGNVVHVLPAVVEEPWAFR
ncbi:hypothetical protein FA15DRAFT_597869 [Coprinopsis marcescibilis]|uniref:PHD-type domain-containing protein n=1 Tax=Coprinopsis marcescibilis TaxID=230819 RepID=A0A5C3KN21_COPMA|nr:hypothetical protein FA15DRAFT_597869 [Coprinopsis marcescibilis]